MDMWRLADTLGLHVVEAAGPDRSGYDPDDASIRLSPGMLGRSARSVLAHEIGHHVLGHLPTDDEVLRARQERAANEWAARRLISAEAYAETERLRNGAVSLMAYDLGVIDELVLVYQQLLDRSLRSLTV